MIYADGRYLLLTGTYVLYNGLSLVCVPTVFDEEETVQVEVRSVNDAGGGLVGSQAGGVSLVFTNAEVDAFTGTGTEDRDKFFNQVEQAVVDYLENIAENAAITFTIS